MTARRAASTKTVRERPSKRSKHSKEPPPIRWDSAGLFYCSARRKDRVLLVTVTPPIGDRVGWEAVAVETTSKSRKAQDIYDDHAHKVVGQFGDIMLTMMEAERFAKQWRDGIELEKCGCGEIEFEVELA